MAEDYAPFDIDVTTEAPATLSTATVAHALITSVVQEDGSAMPEARSGLWGIAYVDIFGSAWASSYSPALGELAQ